MAERNRLWAAVHTVKDQGTFVAFCRELIADRDEEVRKEKTSPSSPWGPGANGWENGTIEQFLDAAVRWAESSGFGERTGTSSPANPWQQFARFLHAGKFYE